MRRSIVLAGFASFAFLLARPVAAQQFSAGDLADTYAKEGQEQVARAKKYAAAPKTPTPLFAPRASTRYAPITDASGRVDMSGHLPPKFYRLRDPKSNLSGYSPGTHAPAARRRATPGTHRAATPRPALRDFSATSSTRSSLPPIPPPPL